MTERGDAMEQRSAEWHEARRGLVTASVVGAILGVSPNAGRNDILRRMVRDCHGAEPEFVGNVATQHGTFHESGALAEYRMETGNNVDSVGFVAREDWAGCSPDGFIGADGGLEIKCPFSKRKDELPEFKLLEDQPHYYAQVQFSLWVTNRAWWHFYQWAPNGTKLERVYPDLAWRDDALPKLRQFHAEYLDAINDPAEYLEPRRVEIDTLEAHRMAQEWDDLSEAIERASSRKRDLLDEMQIMSEGRNAVFAGRNLSCVERAGSVSYAKAIEKYAPGADLEPFRGKPSKYWRFG